MSRPETIDDIDDYARAGHVVATIPPDHITAFPSLGQHLLAALAEAERLGLARVGNDIVIPLTDDELAEKLSNAQRHWDYQRESYEMWIAGTIPVDGMKSYREALAAQHAKREGLPLLDEPVAS